MRVGLWWCIYVLGSGRAARGYEMIPWQFCFDVSAHCIEG